MALFLGLDACDLRQHPGGTESGDNRMIGPIGVSILRLFPQDQSFWFFPHACYSAPSRIELDSESSSFQAGTITFHTMRAKPIYIDVYLSRGGEIKIKMNHLMYSP